MKEQALRDEQARPGRGEVTLGETAKPVRSMLFVPGNRASWVEPARRSGADAVVFDLEGAVPPGEKDTARSVVRDAVTAGGDGAAPALFARVNAPGDAAIIDDLDAVVVAGLTGVLLPHVESVDDVLALDEALTKLEAARGLSPGSVLIDPLVETPQAVRAAYEIASCSPRVAYMGSGISRRGDIARRIGYRWTPEGTETLYIRSKVLVDVRAAGVPNPLSGMWGDVADLDGLARFAQQTAQLGYEGMMVIHPTHVPVVNEIFSPTAEDIEEWSAVIAAMDDAAADGRGAIRFRGQLIDEAHVKTAHQGLARARAFGLVD